MSAAPSINDFAAKVAPINAEYWSAWKLGERESDAIQLSEPETVDEAVRQAMANTCSQPGDRLAVLYTHTGRKKQTLWLFNVKRSTKVFDYRASTNGGAPVKVGRLYPELWGELPVEAFAPVLRFDAFRDDAAGHDAQLVEARS